MSPFAILLLCAQACMIQQVYAQCLRGALGPAIAGPLGWEAGLAAPFGWEAGCVAPAAYGWADGLAGPYGWGTGLAPTGIAAYPTLAAYGGEGIGDVAVAGEMGVAGVTEVVGQVPILGAVEFGGVVPAAGTITISGSCGCGCHGPYYY